MKKEFIKKIIFVGVIVLLFIPMTQQYFKVFELEKLRGSFKEAEPAELSWESWFDGKYQSQSEKRLNDVIGFRPFFVRLCNQFHYSLFSNARANSVLVGKNSYLYERGYINAYYGTDFIGKDTIREKVRKLKAVQEALKKENTELVVVFAPGKATFYPEFIPSDLEQEKGITNFEVYLKECQSQKVNHIDFNTWFCQMKDTSQYPLIPKTGIHWSSYGEYLAADSLISYIQWQQNKEIPSMQLTGITTSTIMRNSDGDIERGMNLLFNIPDLEMAYPSFKIIDEGKTKVKAVVISDSFYWGMFNWGISKRVFQDGKFWYYNKAIYPDSYKKSLKVKDINHTIVSMDIRIQQLILNLMLC